MPASTNYTATRVVSAATTNSTLIKAGPGSIVGIIASNSTASAKFLKLYNKVTAPTVGTDIPVLTLAIPAGNVLQLVDLDQIDLRTLFPLGIGLGITGAQVDTDTTATAVADVILSIFFN